ncbi:CACNA1E [Symbiodinium sp. CCMP2592]|nr:CACNA1E [Symbiodinium sp. CCMP2592]
MASGQLSSHRRLSQGSESSVKRTPLMSADNLGQYRLVPDVECAADKDAALQQKSCCQPDCWEELLHSVGFNLFISTLIVANAVVIGLETDNVGEVWAVLEIAFLGIFSIELLLRIVVSGPTKFFAYANEDFSWNLFDFCVVIAGCFDVMFDFSPVRHEKGSFMTFLRIIRLLRVMRMIRLLRFLRDFHVLTFGFAAAAVAIRNVSLLMLAAIYVTSIVCVRLIIPFMQDNEHQEFLNAHFGSLRKSMLSLFFLLSEPDLMPYWEVLESDALLAAFLIAFVVFVSFGIVGLLTGLVCESMFDKNDAKIEQERAEAEEKRQRIIQGCEGIFETIASAQGHASIDDIMQILPALGELCVEEGVPFAREDLVNTVNCMDTDGSGSIDKKEFCQSIVHLAEGLRPISIVELHYITAQTKVKVDRCESLLAGIAQYFETEMQASSPKSSPSKQVLRPPAAARSATSPKATKVLSPGKFNSNPIRERRQISEPPGQPEPSFHLSETPWTSVAKEVEDLRDTLLKELRSSKALASPITGDGGLERILHEVESVQRETSSQLQHQLTAVVEATRQVHTGILQEVASMQSCVSTTLQSLAQQSAAHVESLARYQHQTAPDLCNARQSSHVHKELDAWKHSFFAELEAMNLSLAHARQWQWRTANKSFRQHPHAPDVLDNAVSPVQGTPSTAREAAERSHFVLQALDDVEQLLREISFEMSGHASIAGLNFVQKYSTSTVVPAVTLVMKVATVPGCVRRDQAVEGCTELKSVPPKLRLPAPEPVWRGLAEKFAERELQPLLCADLSRPSPMPLALTGRALKPEAEVTDSLKAFWRNFVEVETKNRVLRLLAFMYQHLREAEGQGVEGTTCQEDIDEICGLLAEQLPVAHDEVLALCIEVFLSLRAVHAKEQAAGVSRMASIQPECLYLLRLVQLLRLREPRLPDFVAELEVPHVEACETLCTVMEVQIAELESKLAQARVEALEKELAAARARQVAQSRAQGVTQFADEALQAVPTCLEPVPPATSPESPACASEGSHQVVPPADADMAPAIQAPETQPSVPLPTPAKRQRISEAFVDDPCQSQPRISLERTPEASMARGSSEAVVVLSGDGASSKGDQKDPKTEQLVEMGFSRRSVELALQQNRGSAELAVSQLLKELEDMPSPLQHMQSMGFDASAAADALQKHGRIGAAVQELVVGRIHNQASDALPEPTAEQGREPPEASQSEGAKRARCDPGGEISAEGEGVLQLLPKKLLCPESHRKEALEATEKKVEHSEATAATCADAGKRPKSKAKPSKQESAAKKKAQKGSIAAVFEVRAAKSTPCR